jgi:membrane protein implicated in regulation of membrane protease activity
MDAWVWWVIIAAIFAVGEIFTLGLVLAPFAVGAALAALISAIGGGTVLSILVFLMVSGVSLFALRPIAIRHRTMPPLIRTGTAALIGTTGIVLERIANAESSGTVKLGGEVWTARAYDEEQIIEVGKRVQVIEIQGATALVAE